MGHLSTGRDGYRLLQERLDHNVTPAPLSRVLRRILQLLYSPEDAALAYRIPTRFTTVEELAGKLGMKAKELDDRVSDMARRGLVMDIVCHDQRYISLSPVVVGFYEFTFMRTREELPQKELARLFDEYFTEPDSFTEGLFQGQTQICRSLVREEALPDTDYTEILDWERATSIIQEASAIAVGLCSCRHKAQHVDTACSALLETCMTFYEAAEMLVKNGLARRLTTVEALDRLEECKEAGLCQTGDNVQRRVTYMCNCCSCCCHFFDGVKRFNLRHAIVTSNWIMDVDKDVCTGCGRCVKACPVDAIGLQEVQIDGASRKVAVRDEDLCLGCGVCYSACRSGAISMRPREHRVVPPETMFDRVVRMAIERNKLAWLLFEEPEKLSHRALRRVVGMLERSPVCQAALAVKPLRSVFLNTLVKGAKRASGAVGEVFG